MRVSTIHVRALVSAFEALGHRPAALFEATGQSDSLLSPDYSWTELEVLDAMTCAAVSVSGDPAFGLHWGVGSSVLQFDMASLLVAAAPDLRTGLTRLSRFQILLSDRPELTFSEQAGQATLRFEPLAMSRECARVRSDLFVAGFAHLLRLMGGTSAQIPGVWFAHGQPSYAAEYERLFEQRACFDRPFTGLCFDAALLDLPLGQPNVALYRVLDRQADELSARLLADVSLRERIGQQLRFALPRIPRMQEAALSLGLSERSLRRRLADDGSTYSQLVEDIRFELACKLLEERTRPLKQVAAAVGFAEIGAFHRAFKRWAGRTPAEFRARPTSC